MQEEEPPGDHQVDVLGRCEVVAGGSLFTQLLELDNGKDAEVKELLLSANCKSN